MIKKAFKSIVVRLKCKLFGHAIDEIQALNAFNPVICLNCGEELTSPPNMILPPDPRTCPGCPNCKSADTVFRKHGHRPLCDLSFDEHVDLTMALAVIYECRGGRGAKELARKIKRERGRS